MKEHFSAALGSHPERLHLAAHSHHPWPDVTEDAHRRAWRDAVDLLDDKWASATDQVVAEGREHVARLLGLSDGATIAVAPNTHDLVRRLLSCLPADRPPRVLTTDAEFHSFARQVARLEEDGLLVVQRIASEPYPTFLDRFAAAAGRGGHDLVAFSHVTFDAGFVVSDIAAIVAAVPEQALVLVDGYHAVMALPVDLAALADRVFYVGGGYKYAMAGEGCCFLHCPDDYGPRPRDTGWFAAFGDLAAGRDGRVTYGLGGDRFLGATYDPTGWYRFVAVQRWLDELGWGPQRIHAHVRGLQAVLLDRLDGLSIPDLGRATLVPGDEEVADRGNFLTFRTAEAAAWDRRLAAREVVVDHRGDRLRVGLGIYHDAADMDRLVERLDDARGADRS